MHHPWLDSLVPAHIRNFEPYFPSKPDRELMRLYKVDHLHRLNNNENLIGPPPDVRRMLDGFASGTIPIYPNGDSFDLRHTLAATHGKTPDQFLVGNGSCEVITSVIKAFCAPGDNIVTADRTFAVYEWVAEFSGYEARLIPLKNLGFDPQGILDAVDDRTKIVFICNPNNPTGTYWNTDTMSRFLDRIGGKRIVVLDEAYFEYVDRPDYPDGMQLMQAHPNLISFRTFSKMYALAACRIGYLCAAPEVVDIVRRAHIVYSVNTLAQLAARTALEDTSDFVHQTRQMVAHGKELITRTCTDLNLEYVCKEGNYVMVKVPMADTLIYRRLMKRGFMVRTMTGFRFPNWIRVSMGLPDVMQEFCATLKDVLVRN